MSESDVPSGDQEPVESIVQTPVPPSAVPMWGAAQSGQVPGPLSTGRATVQRARAAGVALIAVVVVAAVSGVVYFAVNNSNNQSSTDPDQGGGLSLPTVDLPGLNIPSASPPPPPAPTSETATCVASLAACLMPEPAGSSAQKGSWAKETAPTAAEYADQFRTDSEWQTRTVAQLGESGLTSIAQHSWNMSGGDQVQDVLLGFNTDNGAQSWFDSDVNGLSGTEFFIPGQSTAQGWTLTEKTSDGYTQSVVYGMSGSTVMELWVLGDGHADQASATQWAATQLQLVVAQSSQRPVAAPTTPTPSYTTPAAGTGSTACADGSIDSCLMAAPAGSMPWTGNAYYALTDVTVQQFVGDNWFTLSTDDQATQVNLLQTAGVTQIAHRDWVAADSSQVDVSVLEFATSDDASGYATSFESESPQGSVDFPISGLSNAQGEIQPMRTDGLVQVGIADPVGKYLLVVNYWSPATGNPDAAAQVFSQDFNLLP